MLVVALVAPPLEDPPLALDDAPLALEELPPLPPLDEVEPLEEEDDCAAEEDDLLLDPELDVLIAELVDIEVADEALVDDPEGAPPLPLLVEPSPLEPQLNARSDVSMDTPSHERFIWTSKVDKEPAREERAMRSRISQASLRRSKD